MPTGCSRTSTLRRTTSTSIASPERRSRRLRPRRHAPNWVKLSDGTSIRWHDHRTHWMDTAPRQDVRDNPGVERVIFPANRVDLVVDGKSVVAIVKVTWLPPPPRLTWLVITSLAGLRAACRVRAGSTRCAGSRRLVRRSPRSPVWSAVAAASSDHRRHRADRARRRRLDHQESLVARRGSSGSRGSCRSPTSRSSSTGCSPGGHLPACSDSASPWRLALAAAVVGAELVGRSRCDDAGAAGGGRTMNRLRRVRLCLRSRPDVGHPCRGRPGLCPRRAAVQRSPTRSRCSTRPGAHHVDVQRTVSRSPSARSGVFDGTGKSIDVSAATASRRTRRRRRGRSARLSPTARTSSIGAWSRPTRTRCTPPTPSRSGPTPTWPPACSTRSSAAATPVERPRSGWQSAGHW